ncbi:hypothetical protein [Sphingorhabdus wooponensis]|uniref:Uncharacterized protein n=1 Tax=Sphingorhabdus wooponensis TaxID=940136 RepID=A0A426RTN6_9SPHN|nr:hypothetical protein [Sphingorhabdus wooponensis]RRQ52261.1 hypothetical protein D7D48_05180 [Sphingorhabdus wooponensis]
MIEQRFIVAIGRIERALSRIEKSATTSASAGDSDLVERHEKLKSETRIAIQDLDKILASAR